MITPILSCSHEKTAAVLSVRELAGAIKAAERIAEIFAGMRNINSAQPHDHTLWQDYSGKNRIKYLAELRQYATVLHEAWQLKTAQEQKVFEGVLRNRAEPVNATLNAFHTVKRLTPNAPPANLTWHPSVVDSHAAYLVQLDPSYYLLSLQHHGIAVPSRIKPLCFSYPKVSEDLFTCPESSKTAQE